MYRQGQGLVKQILILAASVLLGLGAAVYGQDSAGQQSTDSTGALKPVIPESSGESAPGKVAKTTPLPATDTPASRVSSIVRPDTYVIGVADALTINVWKEPELSKSVPVRPDGMITLPLVGEIKAAGLTPLQLQEQITSALDKVMSDPQVVVMVEAVNSLSYNMMGQVLKPGYYPLARPISVLDAIALSGGFRDFAKQGKIYILRPLPNGAHKKLFFNYKQVIKGRNMAQNIMVQPGDTIVVP
jgi:polysaccharide export outer membrane protein